MKVGGEDLQNMSCGVDTAMSDEGASDEGGRDEELLRALYCVYDESRRRV